MRLFAENVVADKFAEKKSDEDIDSEDFDGYDDTGFYEIIQRPDNTLEENYQKLTDSEKQDVRALNGIIRMDFYMQQMMSIKYASMEQLRFP